MISTFRWPKKTEHFIDFLASVDGRQSLTDLRNILLAKHPDTASYTWVTMTAEACRAAGAVEFQKVGRKQVLFLTDKGMQVRDLLVKARDLLSEGGEDNEDKEKELPA